MGRVCHSYQTSVRVHSSGRSSVAGWTRSPTATTFSAVAVGLPGGGTGADQVAVEGAARLALGGAADADEAAAVVDVALEGGLLRGVERVAGVAEEDDGAVLLEVGGGEVGRVSGSSSTLEVVGGAERLDGGDAGVDGGVRRPVEDEDRGRRRLGASRRPRQQADDRREGQGEDPAGSCGRQPTTTCRERPDLTPSVPSSSGLPNAFPALRAGSYLRRCGVCQRSFDLSEAKARRAC